MTNKLFPQPRPDLEPFEHLIPVPFQRAIGLVFLVSGSVEAALGMQIGRIACSGAVFDVRLTPLLFGATTTVKLNLIRIYSKMMLMPNADQIDLALRAIGTAFDRRDDIAHGTITFEDGKLNVMRTKFTPRTGMFKEAWKWTADEVYGFSRDMRQGARDLDEAITAAGIPSLHGMQIGVNRLPQSQ